MEPAVRDNLVRQTRELLSQDDWEAVERLWHPWIEQGNPEAGYQLAYHYFWCTPCDNEATTTRMETLLRETAGRDHPDAVWFLAKRDTEDPETDPEYAQLLLRAGQLGSVHAQRDLGALYATGDWSGGTKDSTEAARWYRLAAEKGHADAQYALGFMLLRGEGEPKNTSEGLEWLEREKQERTRPSGCWRTATRTDFAT